MVCGFNGFQSESQFDGIWACASLLHVPYSELVETISHLTGFLRPSGYFYFSFKYGEGEGEIGGRHFTYLNEVNVQSLSDLAGMFVHQSWVTQDLRPDRADEKWLNVILKHRP